jgi:phosphonate C-P lyase system protein PhnH
MSMVGHDTVAGHRAFRALLLALALPGRDQEVPGATDGAAVAAQLLDAVWTSGDTSVVVVDAGCDPVVLDDVPRGTEERPEDGATVIAVVDGAPASTTVQLTGPGIDGALTTALPLTAGFLEARAGACAAWPLGIDVVIAGPGGRVVGLPRTTRVEVLD